MITQIQMPYRITQDTEVTLPKWREIFDLSELVPDLLRVGLVIFLAIASYRVVKLLTQRLEREVQAEDPMVKRVREQRARTLASLINYIALVVIVSLAALTILSTFIKIDIGPLLATAGVAGLAISFGAQSLVKDIINGGFIIMEGQFAIGDVIRVGEIAGQVERITLRTTVLRDIEGVVHILPNGEINRVSNLTKAWSRAVLDVNIAFKEDVDRVIDTMREVGLSLADDPKWKPLLIEPPEVLGVQAFTDAGIVIRLIAKTLPLKQWDVARELRRRIKRRFDQEKIEFAVARMALYRGGALSKMTFRDAEDGAPGEGEVGPGTTTRNTGHGPR